MTLANKLTITRGVMALITFACLWSQQGNLYTAALVLYILAALTDAIDGYIARKTDSMSPFGAMADPIADKVLVIGAFIAFVRIPEINIPTWAVFLIIVRELLMGGLRALAGVQGVLLAADSWGKWSMGVQSSCVMVIIMQLVFISRHPLTHGPLFRNISYFLTLVAMMASLLSGISYMYGARGLLRNSWNAPTKDP